MVRQSSCLSSRSTSSIVRIRFVLQEVSKVKRLLLGALVALSFSVSATDHYDMGDVGSVQIAPCASVGPGASCEGNVDVNINGDGDVILNGDHTVIHGKDGVDGQDGKDGINGTDGKDGAKGDKGDKGDTGAAGTNGTNGKDGQNGRDGTDGTNGKDGAKGEKGDTGATGASGSEGKAGANGHDGQNGKDGAKGDAADVTDNGDGTVTVTGGNHSVTINQGSNYDDAAIKNRITNNEKDIKHNRKVAARGIAGAIAGSNIPQAIHAGGTLVGAGVGAYDGESAVAVGASHRFDNDHWTVKATAAATSQSFSIGAGVGYEW